ncbi:hypothetical protein QJS10_CPB11g01424 [Acorus calamus]|uniref:Uncharacterized protein n=1 Tax=Acorus calamus TaxID=4465 RepID=A0AAV9DXM5_ACOCL|nr:hypothetical protein QJS10_CPB11g01424 [Acorus calamus]
MNRIPSHFPIRLPQPPYMYGDALLRFSLWTISVSAAGLLNLPMSPLQIPPWRVLMTVYAALLYVAFVVGLCVLFVSLLRRTAPPSPSPNRRQTQPGDAVLRLAIWAITLSAGALFNLPTAPKKETQFDEVLAMVYGVTMFLTFNLGWVLLCLNLRNKDISKTFLCASTVAIFPIVQGTIGAMGGWRSSSCQKVPADQFCGCGISV